MRPLAAVADTFLVPMKPARLALRLLTDRRKRGRKKCRRRASPQISRDRKANRPH